MDASKPISANDLLKNLPEIHDLRQNYLIVSDTSMGSTFLKMIEAINQMDEMGWETVSISHDSSSMTMYALVRRIQKAKH